MNNKKTILICLAIIFSTCAICAGLVLMNEQSTTVKLTETCSMNITGEYNAVFEDNMNKIKIFDKFNNKEYKGMIVYCNSKNASMEQSMTFGVFKGFFVGNTSDTGAEPVETQWDGNTVYVIYTGNDATHDNILIISKSRDDCIRMYMSIKYNTTNNTTNTTTTNTTTNTSNTTVQSISTDSNGQSDVSSRSYSDMAHDSDAHTDKAKAAELNSNIVGQEGNKVYFSDGSSIDFPP